MTYWVSGVWMMDRAAGWTASSAQAALPKSGENPIKRMRNGRDLKKSDKCRPCDWRDEKTPPPSKLGFVSNFDQAE